MSQLLSQYDTEEAEESQLMSQVPLSQVPLSQESDAEQPPEKKLKAEEQAEEKAEEKIEKKYFELTWHTAVPDWPEDKLIRHCELARQDPRFPFFIKKMFVDNPDTAELVRTGEYVWGGPEGDCYEDLVMWLNYILPLRLTYDD